MKRIHIEMIPNTTSFEAGRKVVDVYLFVWQRIEGMGFRRVWFTSIWRRTMLRPSRRAAENMRIKVNRIIE